MLEQEILKLRNDLLQVSSLSLSLSICRIVSIIWTISSFTFHMWLLIFMVQNELEREKLETELEEERKSKLTNLGSLDTLSDFGGSSCQVRLACYMLCNY